MSSIRLLFLGLFLTGLYAGLYGQSYYNQLPEFRKANSVWAFGTHAGLNFNSGSPVATQTGITSFEGVASVAHPVTGTLLFYSVGNRIWNANHQLMPNGKDNLLGNRGSTTQGVCIVPVIGTKDKYYQFSLRGPTDLPYTFKAGYLYYSIVDMTLDNGSGDVVTTQKNILLDNEALSESMIAVPGNNCDIWLIVHAERYPVFKSYHITAQGIDPVPVISVTGAQIQGITPFYTSWNHNIAAYNLGGMAVSPDRSRIAVASGRGEEVIYYDTLGTSGILLCKFDATTGKVSDAIQVDEKNTNSAYVPAFSPDNTKLYFSRMEDYTFPNGWVYPVPQMQQFDIRKHDSLTIALSRISLGLTPWTHNSFSPISYLRLYGDTIYINAPGANGLGLITQPNQSGAACGYQPWPFPISLAPQTETYYSLPNEVVYPFPPDTTHVLLMDTLICSTDGTIIGSEKLSAPSGFTSYIWDDGSRDSVRIVNFPGTFQVMSTDGCHTRVDTFRIRHATIPPFTLGADTILCFSRYYDLNIPAYHGINYLWQDNSTGNTLRVTETGIYWVTLLAEGCNTSDTVQISIEDFSQHFEDTLLCKGISFQIRLEANVPKDAEVHWSNGLEESNIVVKDTGTYWVNVRNSFCTVTDTVRITDSIVCNCSYNVPTAFSPNSDGINDQFLPLIEPGCAIRNYNLCVYNRFGQRIYSSDHTDKGWDGTQNGNPADIGTYFFELRFEGGTKNNKYYKKGDITLIR